MAKRKRRTKEEMAKSKTTEQKKLDALPTSKQNRENTKEKVDHINVMQTYEVHIYCTNCQKPTSFNISRGNSVADLVDKRHICSNCGCNIFDNLTRLPYKVVR